MDRQTQASGAPRCCSSVISRVRAGVWRSTRRPGVFNDRSDVDLALETEPPQMSVYRLIAELMERLGRPVDILMLDQCRFRERIRREGLDKTP